MICLELFSYLQYGAKTGYFSLDIYAS